MKFEKWQALGNDYIVIEATDLPFEPTAARLRRICQPHFGVSSDGVLLLEPSDDPDVVAQLRIFNPDGSEAELSGNGAREAIMYLQRAGWTNADQFTINTVAGPIRPRVKSQEECSVDMGRAELTSKDFRDGPDDGTGVVVSDDREWSFQHVSIGNPQCAIEFEGSLEELRGLDLQAIGPAIENAEIFPNRTNVSFWVRTGPQTVVARIFERGVGETLSSGTGAIGAAVAACLRGAASPVTVELDGGQLTVEIGPGLEITLTGWAKPVFTGELSPEFVEELENL